MTDEGGFLCWFCPICEMMTLLVKAEAGVCARKPPRNDCPLDVLTRARLRYLLDQESAERTWTTWNC